MKYYLVIKLVYRTILRPLVEDKVASSDAQWDDILLSVIDKVFGYNED